MTPIHVPPANEAVYLMGGIPLLFLLGFVLLLVFGKRMKGGAAIALGVNGLALALVVNWFLNGSGWAGSFEWFQIGGHAIRISINQGYSVFMLPLVVVITFLVQIFSLAYIEKDPMRHRYWAYLSLFSAAMTGLVLASNLLLVFVCWELVGVASWFLIGFWFKKPEAAKASQKAFIVNRIADAGFIMALMLIWREYGDFDFHYNLAPNTSWLTHFLIGLGLFVGAIGKSAQFPFQVWLPDAMAGPTPVSSLIHAATMVAAGVYLLLSVEPIFVPEMKLVIAITGAFTALIAAISALTQTDIKRVLAYSTVSQLGFMVMGIGVGASTFALFHLIAHAFFKCGLFLVAGVVIHGIHKAQEKEHLHFDAQDMRFMGGLRPQNAPRFCLLDLFCCLPRRIAAVFWLPEQGWHRNRGNGLCLEKWFMGLADPRCGHLDEFAYGILHHPPRRARLFGPQPRPRRWRKRLLLRSPSKNRPADADSTADPRPSFHMAHSFTQGSDSPSQFKVAH